MKIDLEVEYRKQKFWRDMLWASKWALVIDLCAAVVVLISR